MNLFVTDPSPASSAEALDDQRLIKAVLEAGQLLSTCLGVGYRPTHLRHPVTLWVAADPSHTLYAVLSLQALGAEYSFRFGKEHRTAAMAPMFFEALGRVWPAAGIGASDGPSQPVQFQNSARNVGAGVDFTHFPVCEAYRAYLNWKWSHDRRSPRWTGRSAPSWYRCPTVLGQ